MQNIDVAIVGAGLNGLVVGLALAQSQQLRIVIIDQKDPAQFALPSYDSRASALTAATQAMFHQLGLWQGLKPHAQDMTDIVVTDSEATANRRSLLSFALGNSSQKMACLVENHHLFAATLQAVKLQPNITMLVGQKLTDISFGPGLARVTLADGAIVKAALVIGADGRSSVTRKAAGLTLEGWDYSQSAITLTVAHELTHGGMAEEHFSSSGVFAILPLVGQRSSLVWTAPHEAAQKLHALDDAAFLTALTEKFGTHRGALKLDGPRHIYPLSTKLSSAMIAPRLALVGDAAHVVHPLAGLGLNLGFKDVAALVDCVVDAVALGQDIGGAAVLERYERWRRFDTVSMAFALDGLNRLFANDHAGLKFIRDLGLKLVDQAGPIKKLLVREAAGQIGELPRLMRGLAA